MSGSACRSGVSGNFVRVDDLVEVEDGFRAVGQPLREAAFYVNNLVEVEDGFRAAFAVLERAVDGGGRLDGFYVWFPIASFVCACRAPRLRLSYLLLLCHTPCLR